MTLLSDETVCAIRAGKPALVKWREKGKRHNYPSVRRSPRRAEAAQPIAETQQRSVHCVRDHRQLAAVRRRAEEQKRNLRAAELAEYGPQNRMTCQEVDRFAALFGDRAWRPGRAENS